jgi:hypothetical protein
MVSSDDADERGLCDGLWLMLFGNCCTDKVENPDWVPKRGFLWGEAVRSNDEISLMEDGNSLAGNQRLRLLSI